MPSHAPISGGTAGAAGAAGGNDVPEPNWSSGTVVFSRKRVSADANEGATVFTNDLGAPLTLTTANDYLILAADNGGPGGPALPPLALITWLAGQAQVGQAANPPPPSFMVDTGPPLTVRPVAGTGWNRIIRPTLYSAGPLATTFLTMSHQSLALFVHDDGTVGTLWSGNGALTEVVIWVIAV